MKNMKKLNIRNLEKLIKEGFITARPHTTLPLKVYNYNAKTQYSSHWTNETLQCRGLVMDDKYNVVGRPFKKFFNLSELEDKGKEIPLENFEIFDKIDGSAFFIFRYKDQLVSTTRGSFESKQAIKGREILQRYIDKWGIDIFDKAYTYCFELVYPENKIVVEYGDIEDIFLLAVINTYKGTELSYHDIQALYKSRFKIVKRYDGIIDYKEFIKDEKPNAEGYVIRFKNDLRIKCKFSDYIQLHKIVTSLSSKSIWESLREGKSLEEIYNVVPDELYKYISKTVQMFKTEYRDIETQMLKDFAEVESKNYTTRKEKALEYQKYKYKGLMFKVLDKKDYRDSIWKLIQPNVEKPFIETEGI